MRISTKTVRFEVLKRFLRSCVSSFSWAAERAEGTEILGARVSSVAARQGEEQEGRNRCQERRLLLVFVLASQEVGRRKWV